MTWNIKYFKPEELLSPDGLRELSRNNFMLNVEAVAHLVRLREVIDQPILVNHAGLLRRGYRSQRENDAVSGGNCSRHLQGNAFDCTPKNMDLIRFASIALNLGWCGVGIYLDKNFVHLDRRIAYNNKISLWVEKTRGGKVESRTLDSKTISSYDITQTEELLKTIISEL